METIIVAHTIEIFIADIDGWPFRIKRTYDHTLNRAEHTSQWACTEI